MRTKRGVLRGYGARARVAKEPAAIRGTAAIEQRGGIASPGHRGLVASLLNATPLRGRVLDLKELRWRAQAPARSRR